MADAAVRSETITQTRLLKIPQRAYYRVAIAAIKNTIVVALLQGLRFRIFFSTHVTTYFT